MTGFVPLFFQGSSRATCPTFLRATRSCKPGYWIDPPKNRQRNLTQFGSRVLSGGKGRTLSRTSLDTMSRDKNNSQAWEFKPTLISTQSRPDTPEFIEAWAEGGKDFPTPKLSLKTPSQQREKYLLGLSMRSQEGRNQLIIRSSSLFPEPEALNEKASPGLTRWALQFGRRRESTKCIHEDAILIF